MPLPLSIRRRYSSLRASLNLSRDEKTRRRREIESVLLRLRDLDGKIQDAALDDLLALTALGTESEAR